MITAEATEEEYPMEFTEDTEEALGVTEEDLEVTEEDLEAPTTMDMEAVVTG